MKVGHWDVKLRSLISVTWKRHLPRLVVHEKFQKHVKWTTRVITALTVLASVITFPVWYLSLAFAVFMFLFEQFVERSIFEYTTLYVQPMPGFVLKTEEWKGMAFAFPEEPDPRLLNVVGCAFATREYGHKFFELLRDWNYRAQDDVHNNICLSFILIDDTHYVTYLYPNPRRRTVMESFDTVERAQKLEKYGKQQQRLVMEMALGKSFCLPPDAKLRVFVERQPKDRPFWLKPFLMRDDGTLEMIDEEQPILKHEFKFKSKKELTTEDHEYRLLKAQRGKRSS
jgi:hypothetical protein